MATGSRAEVLQQKTGNRVLPDHVGLQIESFSHENMPLIRKKAAKAAFPFQL